MKSIKTLAVNVFFYHSSFNWPYSWTQSPAR